MKRWFASILRPPQGPPFAFALIWLFYLFIPISVIWGQPWPEMTEGFAIVAAFAAVYYFGWKFERFKLFSVMLQFVFVGYFTYRYDVTFLYLAFYPAPLIGRIRSIRIFAASMALLLFFLVGFGWYFELPSNADVFYSLFPAMLVMVSLPLMMRARLRSIDLKDRLALAHEEIARLSKNEERQRISRDLHDTLGHTLSLIALKSELAEKLVTRDPERAAREIRDIQNTSRAALKQVRELISGMNEITLADALAGVKQILAAAGIALRLEGWPNGPIPGVTPLIDNILGMCLRETVTNVVKHSRARSCTIRWSEEPDVYLLTVEDDGIGADAAACANDMNKNGLKGMRERLKLVEGELALETAEARGVRVSIRVPRPRKSSGVEETGT